MFNTTCCFNKLLFIFFGISFSALAANDSSVATSVTYVEDTFAKHLESADQRENKNLRISGKTSLILKKETDKFLSSGIVSTLEISNTLNTPYLVDASLATFSTINMTPDFHAVQHKVSSDFTTMIKPTVIDNCSSQPVRKRYRAYFVEKGQTCTQEPQQLTCAEGNEPKWSGTFSASSCHEVSGLSLVENAPLIRIEQFKYRGGFRTSGHNHGKQDGSSLSYSEGIFTYNPKNHSIFIVGHPRHSAIAEFKIPEIVKSSKISDFNIANQLQQKFTNVNQTQRVNTGITNYFRVTGLELIGDGLMVNYINWYNADGKETDTSVYFNDATNLATGKINGPYQLTGAAHSAGWLSTIPKEWQKILGGEFISGSQPKASIQSRLSIGPSAFAISPQTTFSARTSGEIEGIKLLDFPLSNMLYDKATYGEKIHQNDILNNNDGRNKLWTSLSGAGYGFIIPGTSTYLTIGGSGGHKSGVGYKIKQDNGRLCGGYCARSAKDYSSYYWLWDVKELLKVKLGLQPAYDVRPYSYGEFPTPLPNKRARVGGGAFDQDTGQLYLSFPRTDKLSKYQRPPVILVYELENYKKPAN
jgi:hypothetical protein